MDDHRSPWSARSLTTVLLSVALPLAVAGVVAGGSAIPKPAPAAAAAVAGEPDSSIAAPQGAVASPVVFSGSAVDDTGVGAVQVSVRNQATGQWLEAGGSWGAYARLAATLSAPGAATTAWSFTAPLATGAYGVSVRATDIAGAVESTDAWVTFTVVGGTTTTVPARPLTVWVVGDWVPAGGSAAATAVANLVKSGDAVIIVGDDQMASAQPGEYAAAGDAVFRPIRDRAYPVPGNHAYKSGNANGYYDYWRTRLATFGASATDQSRGWYAFDLGSWHVVALNTSRDCEKVGCGAASAQTTWLASNLAADTSTCDAVFWHEPRWSSGREHGDNPETQAMWAAAAKAGVDLAFGGHDHGMEVFAPLNASGTVDSARGVREFVSGAGGDTLYGFASPIRSISRWHSSATHGALRLTLRAGSYDWAFVSQSGAVLRQGSGTCHA